MPSFETLFLESKGQPVLYKGEAIQMVDRLPVKEFTNFKLKFELSTSKWRQGVQLSLIRGVFEVNGSKIEKSVIIWQDTAPPEVMLRIESADDEFFVKNVWDVGDGVVHSWHNGGAMIVHSLPFEKRYRCNDGEADDDFDDLVFTIKRLS